VQFLPGDFFAKLDYLFELFDDVGDILQARLSRWVAQERDVEVVDLPIAVLRQMLKPLEVDVATHVVAENQRRQRDRRKRCFAVAKKETDVGFYIGTVIHRVAQLLGLLNKREGALFNRQLQGIDLRVDRDHIESLDQLHWVAADQHVDGFSFPLLRGSGNPSEITAHHILLQEMDLALISALYRFSCLCHVFPLAVIHGSVFPLLRLPRRGGEKRGGRPRNWFQSSNIDSTKVSTSVLALSKIHIFSSNSRQRCGMPAFSSAR